jgi:hypothetical protein
MWREREYKYLPQYLDEKYKQNYIWKIPKGKRRLERFMCMWEDDTKSALQKMRTVVGDLNSSPNILTVITSRNTHRICGMRGNNEKFIKHFNPKPEQNHHLGHPNVDGKII